MSTENNGGLKARINQLLSGSVVVDGAKQLRSVITSSFDVEVGQSVGNLVRNWGSGSRIYQTVTRKPGIQQRVIEVPTLVALLRRIEAGYQTSYVGGCIAAVSATMDRRPQATFSSIVVTAVFVHYFVSLVTGALTVASLVGHLFVLILGVFSWLYPIRKQSRVASLARRGWVTLVGSVQDDRSHE